jgi:hypothetical protein
VYVPDAVIYHAHHLTLRRFMRQHFSYGRGACHFHRTRALLTHSAMHVEPLDFYTDLMLYPFRKQAFGRAVKTTALFAISQAANAAGFFWQVWKDRARQV